MQSIYRRRRRTNFSLLRKVTAASAQQKPLIVLSSTPSIPRTHVPKLQHRPSLSKPIVPCAPDIGCSVTQEQPPFPPIPAPVFVKCPFPDTQLANYATAQEPYLGATAEDSSSSSTSTSTSQIIADLKANQTRLQRRCDRTKVLQSRVTGDGRCLFRSVVRGISNCIEVSPPVEHAETIYADRLRLATVEGMMKHSDEILAKNIIEFEGEEDFDSYLRRMKTFDEYAGEPELFVLSKELGISIEIHMMTDVGLREIQAYPGSLPPIRLLYQPSGPHYDALVPEPTFWAKSCHEKKAFIKWKLSKFKEKINSKVKRTVDSILQWPKTARPF